MKVFSWNAERRVGQTLDRQLESVLERDPDVIALQEVTTASLPGWTEGLTDYDVISSVELLGKPYPPPPYETPPFPRRIDRQIERKNFNLLAAKKEHRIRRLEGLSFEDPDEQKFAFPEKYVAAAVEIDGTTIHAHNAHVPPGASRGLIKVHAFEAIRRRIDADDGTPRLLCADFNAPWEENEDGPLTTVFRKWPADDLARWEKAEASLFEDPMRDAYRDVHKDGAFPVSHWTGRGDNLKGHRYDYILVSPEFTVECGTYFSEWLDRDEHGWRASDHAPVEATLSLVG